jgi:hypothetical protein
MVNSKNLTIVTISTILFGLLSKWLVGVPYMAWDIHYKIYDILWNEKELMKKSGKRVSNNRMNTELKRCIIMSHYVKRYFYENVYKEKLS